MSALHPQFRIGFLRIATLIIGFLAALLATGAPTLGQSNIPSSRLSAATGDPASRERLDALTMLAGRSTDPLKRQSLIQDALEVYEQLSLGSGDTLAGFDAQGFLSSVIATSLGAVSEASGENRTAIAALARSLIPRIRDRDKQAAFYIELADVSFDLQQTSEAQAAMQKAAALVEAMPPSDPRDNVYVGLVRLSKLDTRYSVVGRLEWAAAVTNPLLARRAMRTVALAEIASRRLGREVLTVAAMKDGAKRTQELLIRSSEALEAGGFQRALLLALSIEDADSAPRDRILSRIALRQLAEGARPESVFAPYAVSDPVLREDLLVRHVEAAVTRGRMYVARRVAAHLASPAGRAAANAAISRRLIRERYVEDWAVVWDVAAKAAPGIDAEPARSAVAVELANQAADASDIRRVGIATAELPPEVRSSIMSRLSLTEIRKGDATLAEARFDNLLSQHGRGSVAAALYRFHLAKGDAGKALPYAMAIEAAPEEIAIRIADIRYTYGVRSGAKYDPTRVQELTKEILLSLGRVTDLQVRDDLAAEVADVLAVAGFPQLIPPLKVQLTDAGKAKVDAALAGTIAVTDGIAMAMAFIAPLGPKSKDEALASVARALSTHGRVAEAFDVAKQIRADRSRRTVFRSIATEHARTQRKRDIGGPDRVGTAANLSAPLHEANFVLQRFENDSRRKLREVLSEAELTADDVRRLVPTIEPSKAQLVPTGFSNFDEKFSYIRYLNTVDFFGGEEEVLSQGQGTLFPYFILIERGVFDLPTLQKRLEANASGNRAITNSGRIYQINVPLLIGPDATLVVTSSDVEEIRLNTLSNTYIVNSGRFFLVDAKMTSWDPVKRVATPRDASAWNEFSPFYTAWSGSETYMADAWVSGLGYANGKSYGISISSGPVNVLKATLNSVPRPRGSIVDSTFSDMYYAFYSYEADDFKIVGNEYRDNEIYGIDPHDRTERLTIAFNTVFGTRVKHGIITSREVKNSLVVGNLSADNAGSGFMLDRSSDDNIVAYNVAFRNGYDGLTVYESSCNILHRNSFFSNQRDGVKIRNSWSLLLSENQIKSNEGFGVNVYTSQLEGSAGAEQRDFNLDPYTRYADLNAVGNDIGEHGESAFRSDNASTVFFSGNRLRVDGKPLFGKSDYRDVGAELTAIAGVGGAIRNECSPRRPPSACRFIVDGYFGKDVISAMEKVESVRECPQPSN